MPANAVKILVVYDSLTGNVEQMAKLVADGAQEISGVEVRLKKITGGVNSRPPRQMWFGPMALPWAARRTWA